MGQCGKMGRDHVTACRSAASARLGFSYSIWNYVFRRAVNFSRTVYSYGTEEQAATSTARCKDLERAALSICAALKGKYKSPDGVVRNINGDATKLRYAIGLDPKAKTLLSNIEHATSKIPGTQDVRRKRGT